jgi:hypothetical protein
VSSNSEERFLVEGVMDTKLPTSCCVDLVTLLTDGPVPAFLGASCGGGTAFTVCVELAGMFSAPLSPASSVATAVRNQPLMRDCTGDESGVGESEGNDVRLFVSAAGEGARFREATELCFEGRTRVVLLFLLIEAVDVCEAERTRLAVPADSAAAMYCPVTAATCAQGVALWRAQVLCCRSAAKGEVMHMWDRLRHGQLRAGDGGLCAASGY